MQVSVQHQHGSPYAGFWRRVLASLIDGVLQTLVMAFFGAISVIFNPSLAEAWESQDLEALIAIQAYFSLMVAVAVLSYHMLFESSALQATLGKLVLGIKVTDLVGEPIGMIRAAIRAWPAWIYGLFTFLEFFTGGNAGSLIVNILGLVSCIAVAFTAQKQGFHDMLAGALVVRKSAQFMVVDEYAKAF